ncbi:MAG: ATP-binding cassette domain-containing protein, partial [Clostridia bacterium]|nr:ATP-binding cassette domain-containing protein [Clostridia bacterium]
MKLIEVKNLSYFYEAEEGTPEKILDNINLKIEDGEFVAVLGHNGSGKSTFAKHLNAILQPTDGYIYIDGVSTSNDEMLWNIRSKVGMVFQNPDNQIVASVVEEDVAFAPENLGVKPEEIRKRVDDALDAVDMTEYKNHSSHMLSGGQKQRVAIAGIIAMKPSIIVMDEPTAMLDPIGRREVMKTIE